MRKMRKTLSFLLILALVLGSFSVAFANPNTIRGSVDKLTDIAGLLGEEEIEVMQNLGIITGYPDKTFRPEGEVTRAEFAAIITRAMGIPESALVGFATTSFTDTAGYGWAIPYLAFCQSKGIMVGYGDGTARPGQTISVNEAMTMILRAIGYTDNSADLIGRWPSNYITLAQNFDLYYNVARDKVFMSREMTAIAMYNGLTVQNVAVASDGKTELQWIERPSGTANTGKPANLLTTGLECYYDYGIVGIISDYDVSLINITGKVGAIGHHYFLKKTDELVAFKSKEGTALLTGTISSGELRLLDGSRTYAFGNEVSINEVKNSYKFYNGERYSGLAFAGDAPHDTNVATTVRSYARNFDGDEVTVSARVTGSTIREVYALTGWRAEKTTVVTDAQLRSIKNNDTLLGEDFPINFDKEIATNQFILVGVESLDDIAADNVVYVYPSKNEVIRKVAVGTKVIEGLVNQLNTGYIRIDNVNYSYSHGHLKFKTGGATDPADLLDWAAAGNDVVASLDAYGRAFDVELVADVGLFGIGLTRPNQVTTGLDTWGNAGLQVYDKDKEKPNLLFTSGANDKWYRGNFGSTLAPFTPAIAAQENKANAVLGDMIGYRLNSSNNITDVVVALNQGITDSRIEVRSNNVLRYTPDIAVPLTFKDYRIDQGAVVFTYNTEANFDAKTTNTSNMGTSSVGALATDKGPQKGQIVLSRDGSKVIAMYVAASVGNAPANNVYASVNVWQETATGSDKWILLDLVIAEAGSTTFSQLATTVTNANAYSNRGDFVSSSVKFFEFKKNSAGKLTTFIELTPTAGGKAELRVVAYGQQIISNGAVVANRNYLISSGGAVEFLNYTNDAVFWQARARANGTMEYLEKSVADIKDSATVWMYNTKIKDADLTFEASEANVVIFRNP